MFKAPILHILLKKMPLAGEIGSGSHPLAWLSRTLHTVLLLQRRLKIVLSSGVCNLSDATG